MRLIVLAESLEKARRRASQGDLEGAGQMGLFQVAQVPVKAHVRQTKSGKAVLVKPHLREVEKREEEQPTPQAPSAAPEEKEPEKLTAEEVRRWKARQLQDGLNTHQGEEHALIRDELQRREAARALKRVTKEVEAIEGEDPKSWRDSRVQEWVAKASKLQDKLVRLERQGYDGAQELGERVQARKKAVLTSAQEFNEHQERMRTDADYRAEMTPGAKRTGHAAELDAAEHARRLASERDNQVAEATKAWANLLALNEQSEIEAERDGWVSDETRAKNSAAIQAFDAFPTGIQKEARERHESGDRDQLPGGAGDDVDPGDLPADTLDEGIAHEMEHTDDPGIAEEIATDHLAEDPAYYDKLAEMEGKGPGPEEDAADVGEAAPNPRRIDDVGETVWGARKHTWSPKDGVSSDNLDEVEETGEAHRHVVKKAVIGSHDPEHDQALGQSPGASFLKKKILTAVAAGPADTPEARRAYVEGLTLLKKELDACATMDEMDAVLEDWHLRASGELLTGEVISAADLVAKIPTDSSKSSAGGYFVVDTTTPAQAIEHTMIQHQMTEASKRGDLDGARALATKLRKLKDETRHHVTRGDLERAGYVGLEHRGKGYELTRAIPDSENPHRAYVNALQGSATLTRRPAPGGWGHTKGMHGFEKTIRRSGPYTKHAREGRAIDRMGDDGWEKVGGKKQLTDRRGARWARRDAPPRREGGRDVAEGSTTGESLAEGFGLRAVQYGNWVSQEHRQEHLDKAHEALGDLADILGLPDRAIAHGGRLALAFGARGGKAGAGAKASAHYEPTHAVINLTHTRGAGSLAHEWGHFFDHQLTADPGAQVAQGRSTRAPFLSHGEGHGDLHPEVSAAFKHVMTTIHAAPEGTKVQSPSDRFAEQNKAINDRISEHNRKARSGEWTREQINASATEIKRDRSRLRAAQRKQRNAGKTNTGRAATEFARHAALMGEYWERPHELFARAFESYVEDKLTKAGRANTYLVAGTVEPYGHVAKTGDIVEPYPQGAERARINAAMDELVAAMAKHGALQKAMERWAQRGTSTRTGGGMRLIMTKASLQRWSKAGANPNDEEQGMAAQPAPGTGGGPVEPHGVKFRHPETGEPVDGTVHAVGHQGATIVDKHGIVHKVDHGHYARPAGDHVSAKRGVLREASPEDEKDKAPLGKGRGLRFVMFQR